MILNGNMTISINNFIPFLKLTARTWKWMIGRCTCSSGMAAYFQGRTCCLGSIGRLDPSFTPWLPTLAVKLSTNTSRYQSMMPVISFMVISWWAQPGGKNHGVWMFASGWRLNSWLKVKQSSWKVGNWWKCVGDENPSHEKRWLIKGKTFFLKENLLRTVLFRKCWRPSRDQNEWEENMTANCFWYQIITGL